jgi:hypothetical protein
MFMYRCIAARTGDVRNRRLPTTLKSNETHALASTTAPLSAPPRPRPSPVHRPPRCLLCCSGSGDVWRCRSLMSVRPVAEDAVVAGHRRVGLGQTWNCSRCAVMPVWGGYSGAGAARGESLMRDSVHIGYRGSHPTCNE